MSSEIMSPTWTFFQSLSQLLFFVGNFLTLPDWSIIWSLTEFAPVWWPISPVDCTTSRLRLNVSFWNLLFLQTVPHHVEAVKTELPQRCVLQCAWNMLKTPIHTHWVQRVRQGCKESLTGKLSETFFFYWIVIEFLPKVWRDFWYECNELPCIEVIDYSSACVVSYRPSPTLAALRPRSRS